MLRKLFRHLTAGRDRPHASAGYYPHLRRPVFMPSVHVPLMMTEPRVVLAMWVIKGTIIANTRFYVECDDGDGSPLKEFLIKQLTRLWLTGANTVLEALDYGYIAAEPLYRPHTRYKAMCDGLHSLGHQHVAPLVLNGEKVGVRLTGGGGEAIDLAGLKSFWHTHARNHDRWYGRSRLYGAFSPWLSLTSPMGADDVAKLYYQKHSFPGRVCHHPPGMGQGINGMLVPNRDVALDILQKLRAGSDVTLPSEFDPQGNEMWKIEGLDQIEGGADVREWIYDLKDQILEGVGVMPEVVEAASVGSGWSGRKVPQQAFQGLLQEVVFWAIEDLDKQILRPLAEFEFGTVCDYSIIPFGMLAGDGAEGDPTTIPGQSVPEQAAAKSRSQLIT